MGKCQAKRASLGRSSTTQDSQHPSEQARCFLASAQDLCWTSQAGISHRSPLCVSRTSSFDHRAGGRLDQTFIIVSCYHESRTKQFQPERYRQNLPLPSNTQTFTGDLTYYGTGLGACGITSTDSDYIVSISHIVFDAASKGSDPNANPLCGQMIRAKRFDEQVGGERSVDLKVVDRCKFLLITHIP